VDGFKPVPDVRQRAARDDAHRVVDVALLHFVFDANALYASGVDVCWIGNV
jgi:hypothetical protein